MKNFKFAFVIFPCLMLSIYACKKEVVGDQEFVQNHFVGKWPLKSLVEIKVENGDTTINDTTLYSPIDTLYFTADGNYTKGNDNAKYSIDATGENLTIATTPAVNWFIKHLRQNSIVLSQETTQTVGTDKIIHYTEQNLVK